MNPITRSILLTTLLLGAIGGLIVVAIEANPPAGSREEMWKKVDEANKKGLPKTAIKELAPIIESALKDKAYAEAIKAIAKSIALEGNIEGNKAEEKIKLMQAQIAKAPKEMVPVMEAIQADWYWHFFNNSRYRFMRRTATSAPPGNDFTTWDLPRLFAEIDKQFNKALAYEKELKVTPIAAYDALLNKGTLPDSYRPTLYDFIAFEALEFYSRGEQVAASPSDAFEVDAGSPLLGTLDEFLSWKPETTDGDSPKLKAIKLYQAVLAFHKDDKDKSALLDADLHRLAYGNAICFGETKPARYKAALKAFIDQWADHELSATARHSLARVIYGEGDAVEARNIAMQGKNAFPNSNGGKQCHNLIVEIEAKSINVMTERVWTDPLRTLRVDYRNIDKVWFRMYKLDWTSRLSKDRYRPEYLTDPERKTMLAGKADHEWNADLPPTPDYIQHSVDLPAPKGLKPGFYFIYGSTSEKFDGSNAVVSVTTLWVSDLAIVIRQDWGQGKLEGFVLKAGSGEPIANATVKTWHRNQKTNAHEPGPTVTTDGNGLFKVEGNDRGLLLLASHEDQSLASENEFYLYKNNQNPVVMPHTILFTDRAIYRPGQTIHFKGISLLADTKKDNYTVLADRKVNVVFNDVNGKEVAKQSFTTNEFGSFSGQFTAPRDRLAGHMSISVPGDHSHTGFNVEEYKRPKFQVTLDAPKEGAKLAGPVTLTGKALSYNGAAVNGAKVRYRITREVRYPYWFYTYYYWRMPPNLGTAQEIAFGSATTEADGTFSITFTAKPDLNVPEKDDPNFHFRITADVIDTTGETRSADTSVTVGYSALAATVNSDDWQTADKEVVFKLTTKTLDGVGQAAQGTLKIYKLKSPDTVQRPSLIGQIQPRPVRGKGGKRLPPAPPKPDPANPNTWDLGEIVSTAKFGTDASGSIEINVKLDGGFYRAVVETADKFGKPVSARGDVRVLNPADAKLGLKVAHVFVAPKWKLEPGEEFTALWGTGYATGRAYVEIEHRGQRLQSFWTDAARTQVIIKQAVSEEMRGGFTVRVTQVRENRAYLDNQHVDVPWSNKDLTVKWERFVSKLEPAKKETFTAIIQGPKATKAVAEMVAALYDASLDAYLPHSWLQKFNVFRQDHSTLSGQFENNVHQLNHVFGQWNQKYQGVEVRYRSYPQDIAQNFWGYQYFGRGGAGGMSMRGGMMPASPMAAEAAPMKGEAMAKNAAMADEKAGDARELGDNRRKDGGDKKGGGDGGPDLSKVSARVNLSELAFFFPQLTAGPDGSVKMEFTMPEALTKWKLLGFVHDKELKSGAITGEVVTAKDLMVMPNPPRFLREGDVLEFTVKVSNQAPTKATGKVKLSMADARTLKPMDGELGVSVDPQSFELAAGESKSFSWKLNVPDGVGPLLYKAVGATDRNSDGEEGLLPVLSKRILVTESIPLPIKNAGLKTFEFAKLKESGKSDTIKTQSLTVQMCSQPAWYAVLALPYLMEYPHECTEQTFNRLYANALARHIANTDPKIRRVFDQWKNTPALDSPLAKNQDLKGVMIEETPWLRDADGESQARRNVGILFDANRLDEETGRLLKKLAEMQKENGMWPWFPGGPDNEYISLYITTGFGRLRHLGAKVDTAAAVKSLTRLDAWMDQQYKWILAHSPKPEDNHLSTTVALYLYGRSFFLADKPIAKEHQTAIDYWQRQARNHWLQLANRQSQGHLALGLKRFGDKITPQGIMASIKERSVSNEEMGMFWRETELSYFWYRAPIETQAVMIEAFDEVMNDGVAVEDCKVWLLKQKQTQNWKTTKATAVAIYGLLLRGTNLLSSDALVEVKLGGEAVKPVNVEAGTGFYEQKLLRTEVKPEMGTITLKKTDAGVSWGSVHWQYLEDVSKVTPHDGTPLKLEKKLFKKTVTKKGAVLEEVKGPVAVGDEIVVRIVLRTDRDMEYCHMKDHRGSGTEPVNVLSQYKFQDGLYYYQSTKDTATHFFIDYLPKGTYVFEYSVRVQHRGKYPTGLANIECMYAPEFNSHSESISLEVK
ncbi:alpha-2-macroglobulin family protein [soil metagenome]